jgi:hypothetical protein
MKAVFFQGHIEYLGLDQTGGALTAPAGPQDQISLPATITTFVAFATAVNVPKADLRAANPGAAEPLSGRVHAPGCREHRVVTSSDATTTRAETRATIAAQHGVTEPALTAANPGGQLGCAHGRPDHHHSETPMRGHLLCTLLAAIALCGAQVGCHPGASPDAAKVP